MNDLSKSLMNTEWLPDLQPEMLDNTRYQKYSLSRFAALRVAFEPMVSAIQYVTGSGAGTSGFYYVNTKGMRMMEFHDKPGVHLGGLADKNGAVGGGQAELFQLPCDPTMLCMAGALMHIEKRLDDLEALQREMMNFLKAKEKAKIRGNINTLTDVLDNYKYNWNNEKYKTNKHILVQDIRKEAEQSLVLCRDTIEHVLAKKAVLPNDREVQSKSRRLQEAFYNYRLALYQYDFSSFLEVMLLENFDAQYLESVMGRMEDYAFQYRELYTRCYNEVEGAAQTSVQTMLKRGLAGITKGTGELIAKNAILSKGSVDEALIAAGGKLDQMTSKKTERVMQQFATGAVAITAPFVENIRMVSKTFNEPTGILFNGEAVYFLEK